MQHHHHQPPTLDDFAKRQTQADIQALQTQVADLTRKLQPYTDEILYAFDSAGTPTGFKTLQQRAGSWLGIQGGGLTGGQELQPGADASVGTTPKYTITYGTYGGVVPTISGVALVPDTTANIITLGSTDVAVYMQCDFTYDATTGIVTIIDAILTSTPTLPIPTSTIGSGSGTLYQIIYGVTVTFDLSRNASVTAAPGVSTSQNFNVCLAGPSINGPFRV